MNKQKEKLLAISREEDLQFSLFPVETEPMIAARKLEEMAVRDKEYLEGLRTEARHLCFSNACFQHYRVSNVVTADDVCEAKGIALMPRYFTNTRGNNNRNGNIFLDGKWVPVAFIRSRRKGRHSSIIQAWTLRDYADRVRAEWQSVHGAGVASQRKPEKAEAVA